MLTDWPEQWRQPHKSYFMMKDWQSKGVKGQVSHKSNWEWANWGDMEGENVYKGATRKGIQKKMGEKI